MNKTFIAGMTWEEFRDNVNSTTVIVVPVGSTELERTHLPLGVDTIMADGVAAKLKGEPGVHSRVQESLGRMISTGAENAEYKQIKSESGIQADRPYYKSTL